VYDWLILLDREVELIWRSEWSIPKILFIVARYGAFIDVPILIAGGSGSALVRRWNGVNADRDSGVL